MVSVFWSACKEQHNPQNSPRLKVSRNWRLTVLVLGKAEGVSSPEDLERQRRVAFPIRRLDLYHFHHLHRVRRVVRLLCLCGRDDLFGLQTDALHHLLDRVGLRARPDSDLPPLAQVLDKRRDERSPAKQVRVLLVRAKDERSIQVEKNELLLARGVETRRGLKRGYEVLVSRLGPTLDFRVPGSVVV